MQKRYFLINVVLLSVLCTVAFPQGKPKLNKKKQELQTLRGNIKLFQKKIAESNREESVSLSTLDRLEKQNLQTRQTIYKISNQIAFNSQDIARVEHQIDSASSKLSDLTNEYSHFARSFYEQGRMHDFELILTATSMNEMLVRYEYLKRFSDQTRLDINMIASERNRLTGLKERLHQQLAQQQNYLGQKSAEESKLASRIAEQKTVISQLRKDKKAYAQQLKRSQSAAAELEKLIQNLIAEEVAKEKRASENVLPRPSSRARRAEKEPADVTSAAVPKNFSGVKGHLPWPVSGGKIVANFGEQENPVLKTITLNYGIDISVPENSQVKSVADGEVSRIFWLPSYGNLIIIDDYNGLRTVYSHLSDIFVKEGDKVKAQQAIGTVGESLSGSILHFEVWLDKDKQDPETWLSKK